MLRGHVSILWVSVICPFVLLEKSVFKEYRYCILVSVLISVRQHITIKSKTLLGHYNKAILQTQ